MPSKGLCVQWSSCFAFLCSSQCRIIIAASRHPRQAADFPSVPSSSLLQNPWFVAQGMICTASDEGAVEVFAAGQIIEGCNPEDHCSPTYDGTMSGCHHLAVDAMSGLNSKLAELHVGDWMSYNQETGECSLWQTCGKLSPSPASSSFQYCGVSHKVAGEAYDYDYYGSYGYDDAGYDYDNYGYDYGSSMDEEGQD